MKDLRDNLGRANAARNSGRAGDAGNDAPAHIDAREEALRGFVAWLAKHRTMLEIHPAAHAVTFTWARDARRDARTGTAMRRWAREVKQQACDFAHDLLMRDGVSVEDRLTGRVYYWPTDDGRRLAFGVRDLSLEQEAAVYAMLLAPGGTTQLRRAEADRIRYLLGALAERSRASVRGGAI